MKLQIFCTGILLFAGSSLFSQSLTKIWSTSDGLKTPESALFDQKSNSIFVSNIDGDATTKDGNGFISILDINGKIKTLKWVTGLNAPKGQAIYKDKYYVADIDELVVISIKEAKIINRYKIENAKFLNDVTVSKDGTVFVSDMLDHKIYALSNNKISLWLDDKVIENVNGLWAEKGKLYIGNTQILQIDLKTKEVKVIIEKCERVDGIEKMSDGNFIFSNWEGRIFITKGKEITKLLDTVSDKMNTADIDWIASKNLVLVPTFVGNTLDAYQLNP
jgi:DNA-binding beta-propeller fold protein YncE